MKAESCFGWNSHLNYHKLSSITSQSTNFFSNMACLSHCPMLHGSHSLLFMSIDGFCTFVDKEQVPLRLCVSYLATVWVEKFMSTQTPHFWKKARASWEWYHAHSESPVKLCVSRVSGWVNGGLTEWGREWRSEWMRDRVVEWGREGEIFSKGCFWTF